MADDFNEPAVRGITNITVHVARSSLDEWLDAQSTLNDDPPAHALDSEQNKALHARLFSWFENEMRKQAVNRFQMAIDEDYYDSIQWTDEEIDTLLSRGQPPLVFNQIKPTVDWLLGTERRSKMDFKVLPREEGDVAAAEAKTKLLKYLADINRDAFVRSRAFADAVKAGMGVLEDGVRGDPTEDPIFSRYQNWRNTLHDSSANELDMSDARFFFRWAYIDLDVAIAYFPDRAACLRAAAETYVDSDKEQNEDFWYMGARPADAKDLGLTFNRHRHTDSALTHLGDARERVKLIECWYRVPVRETAITGTGTSIDGQLFRDDDVTMCELVRAGSATLYDRVRMRVFCAVMTERDLLQNMESPYRHDRFPFTIIWCYRRKRDNQPYGMIRPIRDPQDDLNKRASKLLHIMSTKQVIMEEGAVVDEDELREQVAAPDGVIVKRRGRELEIVRDQFETRDQAEFLARDAVAIREVSGVNGENLGRDTNANSGKAILAKQEQGGLLTAEIFDNLLLAFQLQGELKLALIEQFWTADKAIRILGSRGTMEWLQLNHEQPDGSILNDITSRKADFVVGEQDYRLSMRLAMFDTLANLVAQLPPDIAVQFLDLLVELGDVPEKEEFLRRIRQLNGHVDPDAQLTPEQQAAQQAAQQAKAQADAVAQRMIELEAQEREASIADKLASAEAKRAEAQLKLAQPADSAAELAQRLQQQFADAVAAIQSAADAQVKDMADQIAALREDAQRREAVATRDTTAAAAEIAKARIEQETRLAEAHIQAKGAEHALALGTRLDELASMVSALSTQRGENDASASLAQRIDDLGRKLAEMAAGAQHGETAAPQPVEMTLNLTVDAGGKPVKKTGRLVPDGTGGYIVESQEVDGSPTD